MIDDTTQNPYAAPTQVNSGASLLGFKIEISSSGIVATVLRWERLRLLYNAALVILVLLLSFTMVPQNLREFGYWAAGLRGAVIANISFVAAPIAELVATFLGIWRSGFTQVVFALGVSFAALLATWCVLSF